MLVSWQKGPQRKRVLEKAHRFGQIRIRQDRQGWRQKSHYGEGFERAGNGADPAFVMKHKANSMAVNTSKSSEVWYVDSGASNHMTSHEEWFSYLEKPESRGVVETGDDTPHTIEHVGEVPLSHVGQKGKLMNVLHVPTITKNLVSVDQIVDQGMQVRLTHLVASLKKKVKRLCRGAVKGRCLSSTQTKLEPRYSRKDRRSSRISTCGTSDLAT